MEIEATGSLARSKRRTQKRGVKASRHGVWTDQVGPPVDEQTPLEDPNRVTKPIGGKVGVPAKVGRAHYKGAEGPRMTLPFGFRELRTGKLNYSEPLAQQVVEAYYRSGGSLLHACQATGVAYHAANTWLDEIPDFRTAIREVDRVIRDIVHQQFMQRVLTPDEKNPAWKLAYFKKWFPEYVDKHGAPSVVLHVTDSLIRPRVLDPVEDVEVKQLRE